MVNAGTARSVCRIASEAAQAIQHLLLDPELVVVSQSKRFRAFSRNSVVRDGLVGPGNGVLRHVPEAGAPSRGEGVMG